MSDTAIWFPIGVAGLTVTVRRVQPDGTAYGSDLACPAAAAHAGLYRADMAGPANRYIFVALVGGEIYGWRSDVWDGSAFVYETGDSFARLGSPAGASLSADVAAAKLVVDDLPTNAELATALAAADDAVLDAVSDVQASVDAIPTTPLLAGSYTAPDNAGIAILGKLLRNKKKIDTATGVMTVYDDDGTTPLYTALCYSDSAGALLYDGTRGINLTLRLA